MLDAKRCGSCKTDKPLSDFNVRKASNDGLMARCRACDHQIVKAWKNEHSSRSKDHKSRWRNANRELVNRRNRERYDPAKARAAKLQWIANRPEAYRAGYTRKNNRRRVEEHEPYTLQQIHTEWKGLCVVCETPVRLSEMWVEHIVPKARGGQDILSNVGPSHAECNRKVHAKEKPWPLLRRTAVDPLAAASLGV